VSASEHGQEIESSPGIDPAAGQASENGEALKQEREKRFAAATGENLAWIEAHEAEILREHPEWTNQYAAVACRTPSKILAVAAERSTALEEGMKSPELLEQARLLGLPPGCLLNAILLGNAWSWSDL
jgi:hypothetical protein